MRSWSASAGTGSLFGSSGSGAGVAGFVAAAMLSAGSTARGGAGSSSGVSWSLTSADWTGSGSTGGVSPDLATVGAVGAGSGGATGLSAGRDDSFRANASLSSRAACRPSFPSSITSNKPRAAKAPTPIAAGTCHDRFRGRSVNRRKEGSTRGRATSQRAGSSDGAVGWTADAGCGVVSSWS